MISLDRTDTLWTVTLDRADKANALTHDMLRDLRDIVKDAAQARVLILTGRGRAFSAGADLEAARAGLATSPLWEELSSAIAEHPGLTMAALNGTVAGGAIGMTLACDLRICVPQTRVFYPVMKLGFLPQPSDPGRLTRLVGPARARLLLMAGAKLTAQEALALGLVERIVAPEDLISTAHELAADACAATPEHLHAIKALCR